MPTSASISSGQADRRTPAQSVVVADLDRPQAAIGVRLHAESGAIEPGGARSGGRHRDLIQAPRLQRHGRLPCSGVGWHFSIEDASAGWKRE
ncbi:hypothetical protein G6F31_020970 [Rhizopus arrhizus]|nr:hypothetical protein G6F31_020970 [Rhizopus arrhizus]